MRRSAILVAGLAIGAAPAHGQTPPPRPAMGTPRPYAFPAVERRSLANGLRIVVLERHDLPLVVTRVVYDGGVVADPPGREGTYAILRTALNDGTRSRSAAALAQRFAEMGSAVADDGFVTTTANFDTSLTVLADLLRNPRFDSAAVERARAGRLTLAASGRTAGNPVTTRVMATLLYGETHPFARSESEASLRAITRADIVAHHASWVRPPNLTIIIVGDVTPAAAFARVERAFGDWPRGTGASLADLAVPVGPFTAPQTTIYLVDVPGPTAYIRMAGLSAPRASPDWPALDVMNAIYGELSGSRLFRELRERRRLTYSSRSGFLFRASPIPSAFHATVASVPYESADSAIAGLLAELRGIAGERPPSADEMEFGTRNRIESLPLQLETHERMAIALVEMVQQNLPTDFYTRYVAGLRQVTLSQVTAAARRHIDPARTAIMVVGDARQLEARLRAASLAPVVVVDDRGRRVR